VDPFSNSRAPLNINREQVVRDRRSGMSLRQVARKHGISRASVYRLIKERTQLASHEKVPMGAPSPEYRSERLSAA